MFQNSAFSGLVLEQLVFQNKAFLGLPQNPHTHFSFPSTLPFPPFSTSHSTCAVLCLDDQFCQFVFVGWVLYVCVLGFGVRELCSAPTSLCFVLYCFGLIVCVLVEHCFPCTKPLCSLDGTTTVSTPSNTHHTTHFIAPPSHSCVPSTKSPQCGYSDGTTNPNFMLLPSCFPTAKS